MILHFLFEKGKTIISVKKPKVMPFANNKIIDHSF